MRKKQSFAEANCLEMHNTPISSQEVHSSQSTPWLIIGLYISSKRQLYLAEDRLQGFLRPFAIEFTRVGKDPSVLLQVSPEGARRGHKLKGCVVKRVTRH